MKSIVSDLFNWPTTKAGHPIFKSTEDAYFFANLIYNIPARTKQLRKAMENARQDLNEMRERGSKDIDKMLHLACKAQFYRECLEELDRIHNDKFFT